jgi:1,4-dihydroxy-2-naphthoate octaprenyltransferase
MASVKDWISAFRLRTLFLAASTVILGSGLALHEGMFSWVTFVFALILALSAQILSNLANDLGDYQKGTDITGNRKGPVRAVQSGRITAEQMKRGVAIVAAWVAVVGLMLVLSTARMIGWKSVVIMLVVGLLCILAAVCYTLGKHAYGYRGWGDFFAFLFFGPVPVIGTYFLHVHSFDFQPVLPSIGSGLISAMILNINNMRDIDNDRAAGKVTLAAKLGLQNAKIYHTLLTCLMCACFFTYSLLYASTPWYRYLYVLVFLFPMKILAEIYQKSGKDLDPYLKQTSLFSFLLAIVFTFCIN